MRMRIIKVIMLSAFLCQYTMAEERLVLELDLERDLLSLSHNIDKFLFTPTLNYRATGGDNINNMQYEAMVNHLAATGLVRLNGEVVGTATEQEVVSHDETMGWRAHSMWMFQLNHEDLKGFMVVEQHEDASGVSSLVQQVMENQTKDWPDQWQMFLSTIGNVKLQYASGDLIRFKGAKFEEYNGLNPADLKDYGRFRGKIRFVITPAR